MKSIRNFLIAAVVSVACCTDALGLPFSELIVFGDSLSDVGNVSQATDEFFLTPQIPADQTDAYYAGRFSNGPVYSEQFASLLGLSSLVHSRSGGKNFAHGNAKTTGTGIFQSFVIDDVDDQVDDYLGTNPTIASDSLFLIFAGNNDLLGGETNVNAPVSSLANDINRLINAGAEKLLVANLPLLGLTPRFNDDPNEAATRNAVTENFNTTLATALDTIESSSPHVDLFRLDVAGLINDAVTDPASFGLVNVTDPAAPGLDFDTSNYDPNLIVNQPDQYLFWDEVHPTTAAHSFLAEAAFAAITFSADFDFDGKVDGLDLTDWESSYNIDALADADGDGNSTGLDFLQWQLQFGAGVASVGPIGNLVPEPPAVLIVLTALLPVRLRRHSYAPARRALV